MFLKFGALGQIDPEVFDLPWKLRAVVDQMKRSHDRSMVITHSFFFEKTLNVYL